MTWLSLADTPNPQSLDPEQRRQAGNAGPARPVPTCGLWPQCETSSLNLWGQLWRHFAFLSGVWFRTLRLRIFLVKDQPVPSLEAKMRGAERGMETPFLPLNSPVAPHLLGEEL